MARKSAQMLARRSAAQDHIAAAVGLKEPNDIIEFAMSDAWLNRPNLYPRQATLLKIIFLQDELFTQFDHDVIGEWMEGFRLGEIDQNETIAHYTGDWGLPPDIYERIAACKAMGRPYFGLVLNVGGRRGSKGHIGGMCGSRVLWHFMAMGDPRRLFGVDRDKRLACQVFAGKKAQAKENQWRDLVNMIMGGPCFSDYIESPLAESLSVRAPVDRQRMEELLSRGVPMSQMDMASFIIEPKEATTMASRGPASFIQFYDEGAHMVATGVSRSMKEVWDSATPALDQFKRHSFVYSGSSPWTMDGQFYALVQETLSVETDTRLPVYPERLAIQLASWDIYEDWERSHRLVLRPGWVREVEPDEYGPILGPDGEPIIEIEPDIMGVPLVGAIQAYDDDMRKLERANPDTFRVERRSKWAVGLDTYLPTEHVMRMFAPWPTEANTLVMREVGSPTVDYIMHGDPGKTGSNFGFAVGHKVMVEGSPFPHVVFDYLHAWQQGDFETVDAAGLPRYEMDYIAIEEEIGQLVDGFMPVDLTFDQWNSIGMIQRLQVRSNQHFKRGQVYERGATGPLNWRTAETFKAALSLNLIHAPYYEWAELECKFLRKLPGDKVDHPDTGPCTTKDLYDAMSIVVYKILGEEIAAFLGQQFTEAGIVASVPGPMSTESTGNPFAGQMSSFAATTASNFAGSPARPGPNRTASAAKPSGRLPRQAGTPRPRKR